MVSQFVSSHKVPLLADLNFEFPEGTHAIGRLDRHSEGLLLLTTDKRITKLLFESERPHERTYLVHVVYAMKQDDLERLRSGIQISSKAGENYTTKPCTAILREDVAFLWPGVEDFPEHVPSSWVEIKLTEGKFHQVRKMVRALNYRCRRLIRTSIEDLELGELRPGEIRELSKEEFYDKLHLEKS